MTVIAVWAIELGLLALVVAALLAERSLAERFVVVIAGIPL